MATITDEQPGGNDPRVGGDGTDEVQGGVGADILRGGFGNDTLCGGSKPTGKKAASSDGAPEPLVFDTAPDASIDPDTIHAFEAGLDRLAWSRDLFAAIGSALDPGEFPAHAGTAVAAPDVRILYDTSAGNLDDAADGLDRGATMVPFARLTGPIGTLSATDFVIVSPGTP